MKLWLRTNLRQLKEYVKIVVKNLTERASQEIEVFMPGYTHLQRAQPIRWSHWLLR